MIKYVWNARKAARNLREHHVSFTLAEYALRQGLTVPIEEQFREGEWRTKIVAMVDGNTLLTISVGTGDEDESSDTFEAAGDADEEELRILRIINARAASSEESTLFYQACT